MLDILYHKLYAQLNWISTTLLLFGFGVCHFLFEWRKTKFHPSKALDGRFLEGNFWYSPTEVKELFNNLGGDNLKLYAITELSLDLVFPVIYFLLLAFIIISLFPAKTAKYLLLIPLIAALADTAENFTIACLITAFNKTESSIAHLAATFSLLKWVLIIVSLLLVVIPGTTYRLYKKISR